MKNLFEKTTLIFFFLFCVSNSKGQYNSSNEIFLIADGVRINIWDIWESSNEGDKSPISELSNDYIIDANGSIFMPFIGFIRVEGRNPNDVEVLIKNKLSAFLKDPFVYVRPLIRVTLSGQVIKPGSYRMDPKSSLWELLEQAEGAESDANLQKIYVERGGEKVIQNLLSAFEKGNSLSEVGIQSGDQIIVPKKKGFSFSTIIGILNFGVSVSLLYLRLLDQR